MDNILIPLFVCSLLAFLAWIIFTSVRRFLMARLQATLQAKLLDRLNSAETLLTYVSTDPGREFVEALRMEREPRSAPYRSILIGVQLSIVLIIFGGALLMLHEHGVLPDSDAVVMGTLPIALGIGLGLAAGATYFLSRSFGLLSDSRP
jgi:hypothetical protein